MRAYLGIAITLGSYLIFFPAMALLGHAVDYTGHSFIFAIGGIIIFIVVHAMFCVGLYLAGQNYIRELFLWATKLFLQKYFSTGKLDDDSCTKKGK